MKKSVIILVALSLISIQMYAAKNAKSKEKSKVEQNQKSKEEPKKEAAKEVAKDTATPKADTSSLSKNAPAVAKKDEEKVVEKSFHQVIKQKFIEGGPMFMGITAMCLVIGLTIAIERILYLNFSTINHKKFLAKIDQAIKKGGVEEAKELCKKTRGPIASVFYEGLSKVNQGVEVVEKAIISQGSIQMGKLESGVSWISLYIALGPMLGFMGTVIGMVDAFDAIEIAGDISPTLVAAGIKVALLTTILGLIVAMVLQVFYNYIISKIDNLVSDMESATLEFLDLIIDNKLK